MKNLLLVGMGGFAGSICRYVLSLILNQKDQYPWGTLTVNLVGSALLGVLTAWAAQKAGLNKEIQLLFATGFCGSFTTFSTFSMESIQLLQRNWILAIGYMLTSLLIGILLFYLGWRGVEYLNSGQT